VSSVTRRPFYSLRYLVVSPTAFPPGGIRVNLTKAPQNSTDVHEFNMFLSQTGRE
jgi:hypothetical protein